MALKAVIFDLDGVLTDTAEYHFRAWKRLADEEGIPFGRADNEKLRGVSRRESLQRILDGRQIEEARLQAMMARKNRYYREMLEQVTPGDLLPGVPALLDELDEAGVPYTVASASRNAAAVVEKLGIRRRLAALADGNSVRRQKPAPDLFRYAAAMLHQPPDQCLVVEDAAAGIAAAVAAGIPTLAVGPRRRFASLLPLDGRIRHRESLADVDLAALQTMVAVDERWHVSEKSFHRDEQHHKETIFTLGNGYFAGRGSFEEGYPDDQAITFAHGVFDDMPVSFTELVNLPNWLDFTLAVDGHPFRLDQGEILHFRRDVDLRRGILRRAVRWRSPHGVVLDLTFERFAAYQAEHLGAIRLLATAVSHPCTLTIHSGVKGHVANEDLLHWRHLDQGQGEDGAIWLHSRTRHSGIAMAAAASFVTSFEEEGLCQQCPGHPRLGWETTLQPGQTAQVDKLVAYTADRDDVPDAADVVGRALKQLHGRSYDELRAAHTQAWLDLWHDCDVIIEGDDEAQLALRFSLFQLLVAAPQHDERVSIGAKTLSGYGYRGHVFWDTEIFIVPFFTYTQPQIARNLLMYRYHTLDGARRKARDNGFDGAQYAWESAVTGDEVTPTWVPDFAGKGLVRVWTGDIQIHISADIAYAIDQYWRVKGDDDFLRDYGAEMVLETAVFWGQRAEREVDATGTVRYALRDVIGPDEYHDHVDNNAYTNRMAQWHLKKALQVLDWLQSNYPQKAQQLIDQLNLTEARLVHWQDVIDHIVMPYDVETGLITQFEGFFDLKEVDWTQYQNRTESMHLLLGIEGANEHQVIKQADVIMLLCLLRDEYGEKAWRANWETYMPLTDHQYGSSLGPSFHAWAACEMGLPDEAYEHFMMAARADLRDVRGNAGDGIHAASAGGLWQAAVFGFAGLRLHAGELQLKPRLPSHWERLAFRVRYQGERYQIEVTDQGAEIDKGGVAQRQIDS